MRIGVDGWRIHGHTGVARYVKNVVEGWTGDRIPAAVEAASLYTPRPVDRRAVTLPDAIAEVVVPSKARQIVWQNTALRRACDSDVLWCPSYVTPLRTSARVVVTTHDATNAIHPELYGWGDRVFYRHFYASCARRATLVVTNNEQTRADLIRHYGVDGGTIRVVPLAPAEFFRRVEDRTSVAETRRRLLGDDRPYLLSVGTISRRRNVPTVIEAFRQLRARDGGEHRLVVVGKNALDHDIEAIIHERGLEGHCIHLRYVSDDDLLHLYNGTDGFVTAATYEANSFTVIEAQACGAPVVIPDVPGMRESTGDVAVVATRVDAEGLADAMKRLVSDPPLRDRLRREGMAQARRFSWDRTARGILEALEEAGAHRSVHSAGGT